MLFGQSIFQSVLERLAAEADEVEPDAVPGTYRVRGLSAGFVAEPVQPGDTDFARQRAVYDEMAAESAVIAEEKPAEPIMPAHLARLSLTEIIEDLALSPDDTEARLSEKRRAFARLNHPDSISPAYREQATTRMKIANLLVDEAIRRLA